MPKKNRKKRFGANVAKDAERRESQNDSKYGYLKLPSGLKMYKEGAGKKKLDIIPYIVSAENHGDFVDGDPDSAIVGEPWYRKPFKTHRGVGPDNESLICPTSIGKKCPICEERKRQLNDGVDYKEAEKKPQNRSLYLVVPIADKDYDDTIHLWDISEGNFQKHLDEELKEDPDFGAFPEVDGGLTLQIRFSEEEFAGNKYYEAGRIDFLQRKEEYDEEIMDKYDLDEILEIKTYKEIEKLYLGVDDEDMEDEDEEEEEEEEPAVDFKKKRKKKKSTPEPAEDEDDEDEDDEEEDDEEEEKPKRSKSKSKKKVVDEPQPKRKKKKKDECPEGYDFGEDYDEYAECEDCPIAKACKKAA
jgi:hypothetical protein